MRRQLLSILFLASAILPASSQSVSFTGKVEDVQGTANQFFLDCTDTRLDSALFDLNLFVGQSVSISGQWNGSIASPSVTVDAIQAVPEVFEIGGGAKIGDTSTLGFTAQPGDVAFGVLSLGSSFLPIARGVVFVDLTQSVLGLSGTVGGTGILQLPFQIPNDPSLVGVEIFAQGAVSSGGVLRLTNPDCKEIDD